MKRNMITSAIQDYLKAIYKLEDGAPVSTTEIAEELSISSASVTGMLKKLSELKLIDYTAYYGVTLTTKGTKDALAILRKHRLLEVYLKEFIHYELQYIHEEACKLEHVVSDMFINKIEEILDNPTYSPMGKPIPTKDLNLPEQEVVRLSDVNIPGTKVIIRSMDDSNSALVGYLEEKGFMPGSRVSVDKVEPFKGPITLTINNSGEPRIIGYEVASNLFVEEIDFDKL